MSDSTAIPDDFNSIVRLFPLPNVVLFPQVMLPLHIFEPRYRQMTADALAGDHLITMVLLNADATGDEIGQPALHPVVCVGKIIADQKLDDGRYNLLLRGLSRARIQSEQETGKLYRSARVQLLEDSPVQAAKTENNLRTRLTQVLPAWFTRLGSAGEQLKKVLSSDLPLGVLCDILGYALPLTMEFKQELLTELRVEQRALLLLKQLKSQKPPELPPEADRKFPPDFSTN